jgi:hypothetical protein
MADQPLVTLKLTESHGLLLPQRLEVELREGLSLLLAVGTSLVKGSIPPGEVFHLSSPEVDQ